MNIKLIDRLKLLEYHKELTGMFILIVIVCVICASLFCGAMMINLGEHLIPTIVFAVCTFVFVILIMILICNCDKCKVKRCQVTIEDEQKCTYQDIVNNYEVTYQNGLIYTIELPEDNE